MLLVRSTLLILALLLQTGCTSSKDDGQKLLANLSTVLGNSTTTLAEIKDEATAASSSSKLLALAEQWNELREEDRKNRFSRNTTDQLLHEDPEVRRAIADAKLKFYQEYNRVRELNLNSKEFAAFEAAVGSFTRK